MKNPEEIEAGERYASFRRGWTDGATVHAMRPEFTSNAKWHIRDEYDRGYWHGIEARRVALETQSLRVGYEPSILRVVGEGEP